MTIALLTAALTLVAWLPVRAQEAAPTTPAVAEAAPQLQPFVATYEAYNAGKLAGTATLQLVHNTGPQWRVDLGIKGNRGFAGILGLNIQQSTVFDDLASGQYQPLSQSTVRKGLFMGKKSTGVYDWNTHVAQWTGDVKDKHRRPIALQGGEMSGLLIDLAVIRDARPGRQLQYRFVDGGRVRDHVYQVAEQTEGVAVGELSYEAMRVARVNGGNDETIFWVADGVPTPVRILQREDGQDSIELRLVAYQGVTQ